MSTAELYRVAEAVRDTAAELAGRNAALNRRNGWGDAADMQESVAQRIRKLDPGALVDQALALPAPAPQEVEEFEKEARRLYINDFRRRPDGRYSYGLTQRFWEMWRAGSRFASYAE